MAVSASIQTGDPLAELNITPLIDVMLVLLVMFIMSIPVAVHDLPFDLPQQSPSIDLPKVLPENTLTISPTASSPGTAAHSARQRSQAF